MTSSAISVQNVSKCYQVYESQSARLRHALWPSHKRGVSEVWALQDINFEVKRGESMAIIGRNGSGKSTLLEIISQTLTPTTGSAQVTGRVAALLELGSGFKPDYTGHENVYLNGLLLGLSRAQIEQRYDDILAFADIGDVLDRPVKTYSSGMLVRLAFAVQVALEPDILIVDEALSVGDYFFQQKCFGRLRKMREDGLTLLFVSHDMGSVRDLCSAAILLRDGKSDFMGDSKVAIRQYLNEPASNTSESTLAAVVKNTESLLKPDTLDEILKNAIWHIDTTSEKYLTGNFNILAVIIYDEDKNVVSSIPMGGKACISVIFQNRNSESGHLAVTIKNKYDQIVNNTSSWSLSFPPLQTDGTGYKVFEFHIDCMIEAGMYAIMVSFAEPVGSNQGINKENTSWFGPFEVKWDYQSKRAPFLGMFGLPVVGNIIDIQ